MAVTLAGQWGGILDRVILDEAVLRRLVGGPGVMRVSSAA
jgi:hypothetical protein